MLAKPYGGSLVPLDEAAYGGLALGGQAEDVAVDRLGEVAEDEDERDHLRLLPRLDDHLSSKAFLAWLPAELPHT